MKLKKIIILIAIMTLTLSFSACSQKVSLEDIETSITVQDYPVTVNDVTISSRPTAVAVLSPNVADIILALGYEDCLVLATEDCTQSDLIDLEKVEIDNYQAFVDAGVTLVVTDEIDSVAKAFFEENNITVFVLESATSRSDFERMYSDLGSVLRGSTTGYENGVTKAKSVYTTLDDISRLIPTTDSVLTAVILIDLENSTVTGDMTGDDVIASAGATNSFKGNSDGYYDLEDLLVANPDYIFCLEGLAEEILTNSDYSSIKAVQNGDVYELSESQILWNGRSLITGATYMAGVMYPSLLGIEEEIIEEEVIEEVIEEEVIEEEVLEESLDEEIEETEIEAEE